MTADPALEPAGEEVAGLSVAVKERIRLIPNEVKEEIRRAHHQLGHPGREVLLRLARAAKKSEDHLFYIKNWVCPMCYRRQAPMLVRQATGHVRPERFNMVVGVDLKEVHDVAGERHTYLNALDVATRFSVLVRLDGKSSAEAAQRFLDYWVSWAGPPVTILHDQGGEFFKHFQTMASRMGAETRVIATEAPWQNGLVEKHGAVLGEIMTALVDKCQLEGPEDMALAAHFAAAAKNRRPDRTGHSARTRVFGVEEKFPGSVVDALQDGENPHELQSVDEDPIFTKSTRLRAEAQAALAHLDSSAIWRRTLTSGARSHRKVWTPGAQVFFWRAQRAPQVLRGRRARMFARWWGPAVVLGRERQRDVDGESYWIAHAGSLMLVASEHLRSATREERLGDAVNDASCSRHAGHDRSGGAPQLALPRSTTRSRGGGTSKCGSRRVGTGHGGGHTSGAGDGTRTTRRT